MLDLSKKSFTQLLTETDKDLKAPCYFDAIVLGESRWAGAIADLVSCGMPLIQLDQLPVREIFPGLRARLIHSERVTHSWVEVDAGATFPEHQHPHEQIVSVLSGELQLVVDGVTHALRPGMVFVVPPNVNHSGSSATGCRVLDAFAPVRDDYR